MKTASIIFIVFVFGWLGWFGFKNESREIPEQKIDERKEIEYKTRLKENYVLKLQLEIQEKQIKLYKNKSINHDENN